jgi:hypothetical protein
MNDNRLVYVVITADAIAVSDSFTSAARQLQEIVGGQANQILSDADANGECRRSIRVRAARVYLNQ